MKRLYFLLCFVCVLLRADQITGTFMLDGETSTDGTVITAAIVDAMLRGTDIGTWTTGWGSGGGDDAEQNEPGNLTYSTIENDAHHALFTPFFDGTTTYDGSGTRGLKFVSGASTPRNEAIFINFDTPKSTFSLGFYFRFGGSANDWAPRDLVLANNSGGGFQALQIYDNASGNLKPKFHTHGPDSGNDVEFDRNHWYWVTIVFVQSGQTKKVRFYDAEVTPHTLLGESTETSTSSGNFNYFYLGLGKYNPGDDPAQTYYFDNIIMNSSGVFPLGPGNGGNNPYWVSPTGTATWAGSQSSVALSGTACASIATMNANVTAGNIVNFRTGAYSTQINPGASGSGTATAAVTLQNYNGETVTLTNISDYAIDMTGMDFYTISGINVTNCYMFALFSGSDRNTVTNCNWQGATVRPGNFINAVRFMGSSRSNLFINSTVKKAGWENAGDDEGRVICVGTDNSTTDVSTHNRFKNCIIGYGGHDAMTLFCQPQYIQDCHFSNPVWHPPGSPQWGNRNLMIMTVGGTPSEPGVIERNTFFRAAPPPDAVGVSSVSVRSRNWIIRNNVGVDGADSFISLARTTEIDGWSPTGEVINNQVYNNTAVYNGINTGNTDVDQVDGMTLLDFSDQTPPITNNFFGNNLFWTNKANRVFGFEGVTSNLNTFTGNSLGTSDPLFTDWNIADLDPDNRNAHDFTLTASSPAINAGTWLTTITSATGSGTSFVVADSRRFTDGGGIISPDQVQIEGQASLATITDINYTTHTITVSSSVSWTNGNGLALAYSGSAPDQGAFEFTGPAPGSLQFVSGTYSRDEDGGTVTNFVQRVGGSTGAIGVTYRSTNGTALHGSDYTGVTNTLSWADADSANKQIVISITNDGSTEGDETFTVYLIDPTGGATLGSPTNTTVTIVDDDTAPPLLAYPTWEIEDMQIVAPFVEAGDYVSQSTETTSDPALGGLAICRFEIPSTGNYYLTMFVNAPNAGADSIFINIDAEPTTPTMIWDIIPLTSGSQQRTVGWRGTGTFDNPEFPTKQWTLSQGEHTMYIRGREPNAQLDELTVNPIVGAPTRLRITGSTTMTGRITAQ